MDGTHGRIGRTAKIALLLALLAGLASVAQAGQDQASFAVGLRLSGSCRVDSRGVLDSQLNTVRPPRVDCGAAAPPLVELSREKAGPSVMGPAAGNTTIVTLVF